MSLRNPFKVPWPSPEASICTSSSWQSPVRGKSCWGLQGPALRAYNNIKDNLKQLHDDRERDLFDKARESGRANSINCFMVGSTRTKARPYIVICCGEESFSRQLMKAIKGTTWWKDFIKEYPGFGGFLLLRIAPIRVADVYGKTSMSFVYSSGQNSSPCGIPIFFSARLLGSDETCGPQQATLGNIIYLDDVPFGLTVAHPFVQEHGEVSERYTQHTDPVVYMDDSGDESCPDSESTTASIIDETRSSPVIESTEFVQSRPLPGSPKLVGQLVCRSEGTPSDAVDWALIVLNAHYFELPEEYNPTLPKKSTEQHPPSPQQTALKKDNPTLPKRSTEQHSPSPQQTALKKDNEKGHRELRAKVELNIFRDEIELPHPTKPQTVLYPPGIAIPMFLHNGKDSFSQGLLSANESLVCLSGNRQYLSLRSIFLEEDLHPGACGQWAFDSKGNWCGHIIAGLPDIRIAYVACASQIFSDIQERTGITPLISPNRRSLNCIRDMKSFAPDQFSRFGGLYAPTLYAASSEGHEKVVQMLLETGAEVNAQGGEYDYALEVASKAGHEKVVQMLIAAGADVNAQGGRYGNAMQAASCWGHEKVVQMLIAAGVDVNAQGGTYDNALQAASHRGHKKVVQMLIAAGVDVNAQGGYYGNAMHAAASSYRDHEKVVQMLIAAGADVNARGGYYGNALQAASYQGQEKVVQMLIAAGVDVNAQGGYYGNALQAASFMHHERIVQMLLDAGADVNAQGGYYGNAMQAAASSYPDHEKVVHMLLNAGAVRPESIE